MICIIMDYHMGFYSHWSLGYQYLIDIRIPSLKDFRFFLLIYWQVNLTIYQYYIFKFIENNVFYKNMSSNVLKRKNGNIIQKVTYFLIFIQLYSQIQANNDQGWQNKYFRFHYTRSTLNTGIVIWIVGEPIVVLLLTLT